MDLSLMWATYQSWSWQFALKMFQQKHFYFFLGQAVKLSCVTCPMSHDVNQYDVLPRCFFPFKWCNLNGLQLFLRLEVSQKRPAARACWSHSSNSSSSSSIISASKSQGNLLELDLWVFSNPTMFTWKLGRWVLGRHAIPWMK